MAREQSRHLFRCFQMAFRVALGTPTGIVDHAFLSYAGQHIGKRPARGRMHQHIVGRDHRHAGPHRHAGNRIDPRLIVAGQAMAGGQIDIAGEGFPIGLNLNVEIFLPGIDRGQKYQHHARAVFEKVFLIEQTASLFRAAPAECDQAA